MRKQSLYLLMVLVTLGIAGAFLLPRDSTNASTGLVAPTPAPSATAGFPIQPESFYPTLEHTLIKQQAVRKAFEVDRQYASWAKQWSPDMSEKASSRVKVKLYSDRNYDGSEYGPDAERGPVWVIIIKGQVKINLPGMGVDPEQYHNGVFYEIAQRTGHLLGMGAIP